MLGPQCDHRRSKGRFKRRVENKNATIEVTNISVANVIPFQFRQLMQNLISNALKLQTPAYQRT